MWNIVLLDEAEKDMKRLDPSVRLQVLKGIQKVAKNPLSADQGGYNDHRIAKSIEDSIDFVTKRQVWRRMIQKIIRAMLIAMNIWRRSQAAALSSKAARRNALLRFAII